MKKYIQNQWVLIVIGIVFCLIELIFSIFAQLYKGDLIDKILSKSFSGNFNIIWILLILIMSHLLFLHLYNITRIYFSQACVQNLRRDFIKSILALEYREFLNITKGEIIGKYTKQINQLEFEYFNPLMILFEMVLRTFFVVITLCMINKKLMIFSIVLFSFPIIIPKLFEKKLKRTSLNKIKNFEKHIEKINSYLKNSETIHNFGILLKIQKKFSASNLEYFNSEYLYEKKRAQSVGISFILSLSAQGILMGATGILVYQNHISAGDFFTVLGLIGMLQIPLYWMSKFYQNIISTAPTRKSLLYFIDKKPIDSDLSLGKETNFKNTNVNFSKVSFAFDSKPILKKATMEFKKNNRYLLYGESGSGKTTSMNLLLGYYEPIEGEIVIGQRNIQQIKNISSYLTVMRQDSIIFQDSLRNNLTMYQDIEDEKLVHLLKKVGLEYLANKNSLGKILTQEGSNLSGGERKRICLARSLLRKSPILILDEPFANIDPENLNKIEKLILSIKDRTVIIISHQISVDKWHIFDAVYHFNGGKVSC